MKKIFSNNRLIAIAFFTVFTTGISSAALATNDPKPAVPVELTFAGYIRNQPLFQLNFTGNAQQDEFVITISDEYGIALYKENIKGQVFTKKFLLNTDEIGENTLRFEVYCKKTNNSVVYEVNRNSRTIQDVNINEVR
jgi:hypothetical protein